MSEILGYMLFGDRPHRNMPPRAVDNRRPEHGFCGETPLCVMAERAMPKVGQDHLRRVDYVDSRWRVLLLQRFDSIRAR